MHNQNTMLFGPETHKAWELLRDIERRRIEVGGNRIANWLARRRAQNLRGEIGRSVSNSTSKGVSQAHSVFELSDPKDIKLLSAAAEIAAESTVAANHYRLRGNMILESMQIALPSET